MSTLKGRSALVIAIAMTLALGILPGCTQSPSEGESVSGDAVESVLGPYPMNVTVWVGDISLTLESVEVRAADATSGSFIYRLTKQGEVAQAPAGSRFANVILRVGGTSSDFASGPDLLGDPVVVADGTTIPVGARARVQAEDVTESFTEMMEFAVPDHVDSAILHVSLNTDSPEALTFLLW